MLVLQILEISISKGTRSRTCFLKPHLSFPWGERAFVPVTSHTDGGDPERRLSDGVKEAGRNHEQVKRQGRDLAALGVVVCPTLYYQT